MKALKIIGLKPIMREDKGDLLRAPVDLKVAYPRAA